MTTSNSPPNRSLMARLFEAPSLGKMAPVGGIIVYGLLIAWAAFVLFPIYWVFITSFKNPISVNSGPFYLPWVDFTPSLHAWHELFVFDYKDTLQAYFNSIVIALFSTLLCVIIGSMAAYALARIQYRPKFGTIMLFVLSIAAGFVAIGFAGVDWRLALAVALVIFFFLARALNHRFKASLRRAGRSLPNRWGWS